VRLVILSITIALAAPVAAVQRVDAGSVLRRAGEYAEQYQRAFSTVVAEEHYVQRIAQRMRPGAAEWAPEGARTGAERTMKSDFMLIRGVAGEEAWFAFRDVFEVDGTPVSGERGRLEAWLNESRYTLAQRARALALEQARYNLGGIVRTINTPLLPLELLTPRHQKRFRFRLQGSMPLRGPAAAVIAYEERERPTIIRTPEGRDVPASGRLWIEPETGRVLMTELRTGGRDPNVVQATITVTYDHHERLQMLVPVQMDEVYAAGATEVQGSATYVNYRRFETGARIVK